MAGKRTACSNYREVDYESDESAMDKNEPLVKMQKFDGSANYSCPYNSAWAQNYPTCAVPFNKKMFHCIPCGKNISCCHQGLRDVKVHCERDIQKKNVKGFKEQKSMTSFLRGQGESTTESKTTKAEVTVTNFLVQHNLPIATADNTNATIGAQNSIASRFKEKSPSIIIAGCLCHLLTWLPAKPMILSLRLLE